MSLVQKGWKWQRRIEQWWMRRIDHSEVRVAHRNTRLERITVSLVMCLGLGMMLWGIIIHSSLWAVLGLLLFFITIFDEG